MVIELVWKEFSSTEETSALVSLSSLSFLSNPRKNNRETLERERLGLNILYYII